MRKLGEIAQKCDFGQFPLIFENIYLCKLPLILTNYLLIFLFVFEAEEDGGYFNNLCGDADGGCIGRYIG